MDLFSRKIDGERKENNGGKLEKEIVKGNILSKRILKAEVRLLCLD